MLDLCSSSADTVGAQPGVRPVQPVGCHSWSAARCVTCAVRRLALLERSKACDLCSPSIGTVGAQRGVLPVQPVEWHRWSAARCPTCATRRMALLERTEVSYLCSPSIDVTVVRYQLH